MAEDAPDGDPTLDAEVLRAVFHAADDAIFIHDGTSGEILHVNERAVEMYGYSRSEFRSGTVGSVSSGDPPYVQQEAQRRIARAMDGDTQRFEWQAQDKHGEIFWVEVSLRRTVIDDSPLVIAVVHDIDDRKRYQQQLEHREEQLKQTNERLVEEREQYEALLKHSHDGVAIVQDQTFVYVNRAMEELTGRYDLEGCQFTEIIAPEDRALVRKRYRQRIEGEEPPSRYDIGYLRPDGSVGTVNLQVSRTTYEGEPATLATFQDVTERVERERELERTKQQLERQNERLEQFAEIISHDIRNPLQIARAYLEEAERTGSDSSFQKIWEATDRIEAIIEDVLTLARQGGELDETELIAITEIARTAWETVDTQSFSLTTHGDIVVEGDPTQCQQLFENLFRNSVEHSSTSNQSGSATAGRCGRITVGPIESETTSGGGDERCGFYVADDGPGIPEDKREDVLEFGVSTA